MISDLSLLKKYKYPKDKIEKLILDYRSGKITPDNNTIRGTITYPKESDFVELPAKDTVKNKELFEIGMKAIEAGGLGIVVLNGGMATRFGGRVKGTVEVFDGMSFLELKINDAFKVSGKIKVYLMNSFASDKKTKEHMEEKGYSGNKDIEMFNQYIAPRITEDGQYFKADQEEEMFYGPGHGDFPSAFKESGLLDKFIGSGGKYIFFSNVDNLGARVDPVVLGLHISLGNELTAEIAMKSPGDEGGAPAVVDGKLQLVEGFCFPEQFDQSKIPVFNCSTYWVDAENIKKDFDLPWYVVKKNVNEKTIIQFERLAGDLTKFLKTNFLKVPREDRFYPIKRPEDLEENRKKLKEILGY